MRILVTDATGAVGRLVTQQLIAAGHSVSGIADRPHPCVDRNVELVCSPLHAPILRQLADEADAVIHLAPVDDTAPGGAGLDGLAQVTDAAARAGARLLMVSQAAGPPDLYGPAEALVASSWGRVWSSGSPRRSAASSTGWYAGRSPRCCAPRRRCSRCVSCTSRTWCASCSSR